MKTCGKLAASSSYGDFKACVNLLQACFTLVVRKLADLQCKSAANLLQTKITIWDGLGDAFKNRMFFKTETKIKICSKLVLQVGWLVDYALLLCRKFAAKLPHQVCQDYQKYRGL
ncbi:hypothetical protein AVEN_48876-1 [Araneus ventricosus]|uniref:Uncharacterized protein n=1 Tax=Araneus ventricosus TaxID=182803 RepID=A0A4Y2AHX2_ARAVE|nr:hypothetical protein AVEN_48876-1 [Araneus ventricosus]